MTFIKPRSGYSLGMPKIFRQLISSTGMRGPSATKLQYIVSGHASVLCAVAMTVGGVYVYVFKDCKADAVYWTACLSLWGIARVTDTVTKMQQASQVAKAATVAAKAKIDSGDTAPGDGV